MSGKLSATKLKSVVKGIQNLYPVLLADSSWDNTGLLVDSSHTDEDSNVDELKILLTVDLTQSVVEEAIKTKTNIVLLYHPFIFRGLKQITHKDPQQSSLIKLIQNNISVYSPHTAIDSAPGGVNDWLLDGIKSNQLDPVVPLEPNLTVSGAGMGRLLTLKEPITIDQLVTKVKSSIGQPYIQIAQPTTAKPITTVAICAGSGGGVFKNVEADCYYTGELSHHELLYLKEQGNYVIACNHSNTERGFLKVLRDQLLHEFNNEIQIIISETDTDPYETV